MGKKSIWLLLLPSFCILIAIPLLMVMNTPSIIEDTKDGFISPTAFFPEATGIENTLSSTATLDNKYIQSPVTLTPTIETIDLTVASTSSSKATQRITSTAISTITPNVSPTTPTPTPAASTSTPEPTSQSSDANTFYVSTSGNDNNPGTYQQPWRTISQAAQSLSSGQTAIVLAGTYPESVSISRNGITLKAEGTVQMKGFAIKGNNNIVEGFSISNPNTQAGFKVFGDNNLIVNNEIFHMGQDGIWFFGSGNTYRGNYIHDILDPSITGDPHADCFQTWAWGGDVDGALFEDNTCDHNRSSGSNQIFMVEASGGSVSNIVIRNNTFFMHDAGYSPAKFNRKDGQYPITGIYFQNNYFENTTGDGQSAIKMNDVDGGEIVGNKVVGYDDIYQLTNTTNILINNNTLQ